MNILQIIFITAFSISVFGLFIYYLINIYCSNILVIQPSNEPNIFSVNMFRPVETTVTVNNIHDIDNVNIEVIDLQAT